MFGILKTIGSFIMGQNTSKGADRVMDAAAGVGNWVDNLKHTDQEKATLRAAMNETVLDAAGKFMEQTVGECSERSITRRELALLIIRFELALIALSIALYKIDLAYAEFIWNIATTDPLNYLVGGVGAFFFMAHIVRASKGG
jgi:hypothetical protein